MKDLWNHPTNPNIPKYQTIILDFCKKQNITDCPLTKKNKPDFRKKRTKEIVSLYFKSLKTEP